MVSERKTIQPECSRTLKGLGFYVDTTRDFLRCPSCYTPIYPDSVKGKFDNIGYFPIEYGKHYIGAFEVKMGTSTNLPFNKISGDQRMWFNDHKDSNDYDSFWLWYCIGERINGKDYPRRTFLIPFYLLLELENSLERKSIRIDQEEVQKYELVWEGDGFWNIPNNHELWVGIKESLRNTRSTEGEI